MAEKKKKTKKDIKVRHRDLKPRKDVKGAVASRIYASPKQSALVASRGF